MTLGTKGTSTVVLALALLVLLPAAAGAAGQIAAMSAAADGVVWQPQVGAYDRMILTVSGPDGVVRQEFKPGTTPYFSLYDADGYPLADGSYTWELQLVPHVDTAARAELAAGRASGDDMVGDRLRAVGALPADTAQSGFFAISGGALVGDAQEAPSAAGSGMQHAAAGAMTPASAADQVIPDDLIVQMSLCVGVDCVNGENFGFDTIRLKENNLRIKFEDTSVGSFPTEDWQLTANDSASGGANRFSIEAIAPSVSVPFTIKAGGSGANNALFIDDAGRVGFGTATPVLDLHVVSGNTPALRLEQNGSSGFTPQTWDVAGNEANFFVRDATNGSKLPFKIQPGAANNSLVIANDGDVGVGTLSPGTLNSGTDVAFQVSRSDGSASILVEETNATVAQRTLLELRNAGRVDFSLNDSNQTNGIWSFSNANNASQFIVTKSGSGVNEMVLASGGAVTFAGQVNANGGADHLPDYVFEPNYELMPLDQLSQFVAERKHLPNVPSRDQVEANGGIINMTQMQYQLLEKIEELTLYTIAQDKTIQQLQDRLQALEVPKAE